MDSQWGEYVPVARRKAQARKYAKKLAKKRGFAACPVTGLGRNITKTFWGNSWCDNLESYSDYANRLPRGRTYARNGSIVDLIIAEGKVNAIIGGSDVYEIEIEFGLINAKQWKTIKKRCAESIDSVMSLLQGRFDESVMADLSRQKEGLFPTPKEITFQCDCPDWAYMCKHVAAVLYGIGARLDKEPEMLFQLRGVDHLELVTDGSAIDSLIADDANSNLVGQDLGALFGIEIDTTTEESSVAATGNPQRPRGKKMSGAKKRSRPKKMVVRKKATRKKAAKQKAAKKKVVKKKASKKKVVKKRPARKKVPKRKTIAMLKSAAKISTRKKPTTKVKTTTRKTKKTQTA